METYRNPQVTCKSGRKAFTLKNSYILQYGIYFICPEKHVLLARCFCEQTDFFPLIITTHNWNYILQKQNKCGSVHAYWGLEVQLHSFVIREVYGSQWSAGQLHAPAVYPRQWSPRYALNRRSGGPVCALWRRQTNRQTSPAAPRDWTTVPPSRSPTVSCSPWIACVWFPVLTLTDVDGTEIAQSV